MVCGAHVGDDGADVVPKPGGCDQHVCATIAHTPQAHTAAVHRTIQVGGLHAHSGSRHARRARAAISSRAAVSKMPAASIAVTRCQLVCTSNSRMLTLPASPFRSPGCAVCQLLAQQLAGPGSHAPAHAARLPQSPAGAAVGTPNAWACRCCRRNLCSQTQPLPCRLRRSALHTSTARCPSGLPSHGP